MRTKKLCFGSQRVKCDSIDTIWKAFVLDLDLWADGYGIIIWMTLCGDGIQDTAKRPTSVILLIMIPACRATNYLVKEKTKLPDFRMLKKS
jgi:hypothetical protein